MSLFHSKRGINILSGKNNRGYESVDTKIENVDWYSLSYDEKNKLLFLRQKKTLDMFLERGAISQAQHDKSLHDMIEKMGAAIEER